MRRNWVLDFVRRLELLKQILEGDVGAAIKQRVAAKPTLGRDGGGIQPAEETRLLARLTPTLWDGAQPSSVICDKTAGSIGGAFRLGQ